MPIRFGLLILVCSSSLDAAEPELPHVAAARQRESALQSVEFVCHVKQTALRGALGLTGPTAQKPVPETDTVVQGTTRLIYDGTRARFETDAPNLGTLRQHYEIRVQSDREQRVLLGYVSPTKRNPANPEGVVAKQEAIGHFSTATDPVVLVCRWSRVWKLMPNPPAPIGTTIIIDGSVCEGYSVGKLRTLWADVRQGLVRRIDDRNNASVTSRCDVRYQEYPGIGLLPATWTWTQHAPDGHLRCTMDVTAEALHVNERFADELFELKFPPGTRFRRDHQEFRVSEDGEEVLVSQAERPPAPPPPAWELSNEQKYGLAAVAVGAVALVGWRLRETIRKPA